MALQSAAYLARSLDSFSRPFDDEVDDEIQAMLNDKSLFPVDNSDNLRDGDKHSYIPLQTYDPKPDQEDKFDGQDYQNADSSDTRCGFGSCAPTFCQKFAKLDLFVVVYGVAEFWMMVLGPILISQTTSIERHLGLSSSQLGMIFSSNEVGYLLVIMFGSHAGKYLHIPRTLAFSAVVYGLACMTMSLVGFADVSTQLGLGSNSSNTVNITSTIDQHQYLCNSLGADHVNESSQSLLNFTSAMEGVTKSVTGGPPQTQRSMTWAFWLLIGSSAVGGVVRSYRFPLFTHYLESNVKVKSRSAFLIGLTATAMIFGMPFAMFFGAYLSSIPVDFGDSSLTQKDSRWVGAWWLGPAVIGVACILVSPAVMVFPRRMPDAPRNTKKDAAKVNQPDSNKTQLKQIASDLPKSLRRILCKPIFMLVILCSMCESIAMSGLFSYGQKYLESQFNKSPQEVSMSIGVVVIFSLAAGTFLGGLLTTKLKLGVRGCAIFGFIRLVLMFAVHFFVFLFACDNIQLVSSTENLDSCECDTDSPLLVCGENQVSYLSPCFAGCSVGSENVFSNCSAIEGSQIARPGLCDDGCPYFIYFIVIVNFFENFIATLGIVPGYIFLVRFVTQEDQALAMGIFGFVHSLFGNLPSPIIFGNIIDSTCDVWHPEANFCMLYNRREFRLLYNGTIQAVRFVHILLNAGLIVLVLRLKQSPPPDTDGDEKTSAKK